MTIPRPTADHAAWIEELILDAPTGMAAVIPAPGEGWRAWLHDWARANRGVFDIPDPDDYFDFASWSDAFYRTNA